MTLLFRKKVFPRSCLVAIGANLPSHDGSSAQQACERAVRRVHAIAHCDNPADAGRTACRSRWFSSAPVPASDQPRFVNGMMRLSTRLDPEALLQALQGIEQEAGRQRGVANAARTLDLDLIDMDGCRLALPHLTLPHPRAHLRAFVLLPLRDVAPDWVHPVLGRTVQALVAALPEQDIRPV